LEMSQLPENGPTALVLSQSYVVLVSSFNVLETPVIPVGYNGKRKAGQGIPLSTGQNHRLTPTALDVMTTFDTLYLPFVWTITDLCFLPVRIGVVGWACAPRKTPVKLASPKKLSERENSDAWVLTVILTVFTSTRSNPLLLS
jgi:hypothetical protein